MPADLRAVIPQIAVTILFERDESFLFKPRRFVVENKSPPAVLEFVQATVDELFEPLQRSAGGGVIVQPLALQQVHLKRQIIR